MCMLIFWWTTLSKFNFNKLQPGDILLFSTTKQSPLHDKLISFGEWLTGEKMTKHSYHHAAMVGNDGQIFEAIWKGTVCHEYADVDQTGFIEVYRVKGASKQQAQ